MLYINIYYIDVNYFANIIIIIIFEEKNGYF